MSSPWRVGALVLAVHVAWVAAFFATGHEIRDFIRIGPEYVSRPGGSEEIRFDPGYDYPENRQAGSEGQGYDGQFSYYIALDPDGAEPYLDNPSYRYTRILYPVLARGLALGDSGLVPWALLLINLVAIAGGTVALAEWLRRRGSPPWLALVYGLFPGLLLAIQRDLTEPLAYGLVAAAVLLFDFGGRRGVLAAGALFGLAVLARQTTALFPLLILASILLGRPNASGRGAASFATLAFLPALVWAGVLLGWLGELDGGSGNIVAVPFAGVLEPPLELARQPPIVVALVAPALLFTALVLLDARGRRDGVLERALLVANVLLAVVFAGSAIMETYTAAGRVSTGVVLAALLCVPYLRAERVTLLAAAAAFALWLCMFPVVLAYGFTDFKV